MVFPCWIRALAVDGLVALVANSEAEFALLCSLSERSMRANQLFPSATSRRRRDTRFSTVADQKCEYEKLFEFN